MNYPVLGNRTIIITSSKKNPKYQNFVKTLNKDSVSSELLENNINVMENITDDDKHFDIQLYDFGMQLINKQNDFTNDTFKNIIDIYGGLKQPKQEKPQQQDGGYIDYRTKYYKYKTKYTEMKNVIINYNYDKIN